MVLFQNCVRQSRSPTKMATTVQLHCYWKQLWSRWAITGSRELLVLFSIQVSCFFNSSDPNGSVLYCCSWSSFNCCRRRHLSVSVTLFFEEKNWPLGTKFHRKFSIDGPVSSTKFMVFFYQHYAQQKHETLIKGYLLFFCMQHLLFNWCWRFLYPRN
jgi:hypothetical protein